MHDFLLLNQAEGKSTSLLGNQMQDPHHRRDGGRVSRLWRETHAHHNKRNDGTERKEKMERREESQLLGLEWNARLPACIPAVPHCNCFFSPLLLRTPENKNESFSRHRKSQELVRAGAAVCV